MATSDSRGRGRGAKRGRPDFAHATNDVSESTPPPGRQPRDRTGLGESFHVPDDFVNQLRDTTDSEPGVSSDTSWLQRLPEIVDRCAADWELEADGPLSWGTDALVIPVRQRNHRAVVKFSRPERAVRGEHVALRHWDGEACVRMFAAAPRDGALLLERCRTSSQVREASALEVSELIGQLLHELIHPPVPGLDAASQWCVRLLERLSTPLPLPRRFIDQGRSLAKQWVSDERIDAELVNVELHDRNVMVANRSGHGPRLVAVNPKPMNGHRAMTLAALVWNRPEEMAGAHNVRQHLRWRIDYGAEPAGVEADEARSWTILRLLDRAWDQLRHNPNADMTATVAMIKAMQG